MKKLAYVVAVATAVVGHAVAQQQRVMVGATPSNLLVDWSQVLAVPDAQQADAFIAVMPLSALSSFVVFDPDLGMDFAFGAGNWSRCRMQATEWAYLSPDACAHQPGPLGGPMSLLTTDYDYGPYSGHIGQPLFADATWFVGSGTSVLSGLPGLSSERWQLRTRGWNLTDFWNGCSSSWLTPQFSGWLGVRFVVTFS